MTDVSGLVRLFEYIAQYEQKIAVIKQLLEETDHFACRSVFPFLLGDPTHFVEPEHLHSFMARVTGGSHVQ